jgi:hypothetical protein
MTATNYLKVISDCARTTRDSVFPFGESFGSKEAAIAGAREEAREQKGRVVAWKPFGEYDVVGEPSAPSRPTHIRLVG